MNHFRLLVNSLAFCFIWAVCIIVAIFINYEALVGYLADKFSSNGIIERPNIALLKVIFAPAYCTLILISFYQFRRKIYQVPLVVNLLFSIYLIAHLVLSHYLYYQPRLEGVAGEDSILEWMTVLLSLLAVLGFLISGANNARISFLFALVWFCFAAEEVSWGQRILSFESPEVFEKLNDQKETNIHNIINPILRYLYPLFFISVTLFLTLLRSSRFLDKLYSFSGVQEILEINDRYFIWLLPLSSSILSLPFISMFEFTEQQFGLLGFLLSYLLLWKLIHSNKSSGTR